jgi:hypothetical protein
MKQRSKKGERNSDFGFRISELFFNSAFQRFGDSSARYPPHTHQFKEFFVQLASLKRLELKFKSKKLKSTKSGLISWFQSSLRRLWPLRLRIDS